MTWWLSRYCLQCCSVLAASLAMVWIDRTDICGFIFAGIFVPLWTLLAYLTPALSFFCWAALGKVPQVVQLRVRSFDFLLCKVLTHPAQCIAWSSHAWLRPWQFTLCPQQPTNWGVAGRSALWMVGFGGIDAMAWLTTCTW
jgi:hypothetical protein